MSKIPSDPYILLSWVNTQLRDNYRDLDELCKSEDINQAEIELPLKDIEYVYDSKLNQFR